LITVAMMRPGAKLASYRLLAAALAHLDFFTWLADHPATLGAICAQFAIHPRPADVMLTLFTAMGLTTKAGGVFHLLTGSGEYQFI
jgi:hypothetical protein